MWSVCIAERTVVCKDAHQMHAAVGAQTGARIVRTAAVCLDAKSGDGRCPDRAFLCSVLAAMVRTPAGHGWSLSARVVAEPCAGLVQDEWQGETGSRSKLHGGRAPPCARCCARMRIR